MNKIAKAYYDPKTGYISADKLARKLPIEASKVHQFLNEQPVVQKLKPKTKHESQVPIQGPVGSYQIDLIFIPVYKASNNGYQAILTCVGINSRKGYAVPIKNKNKSSIVEAVETLINQIRRGSPKTGLLPSKLVKFQSDKGSEFTAKSVQSFIDKHGIIQDYSETGNHIHMGMIESFNRTLKRYLSKHFVHTGTTRWIDVLDDLMYNYNTTYHTGIDRTPESVDEKSELDIMLEKLDKTANLRNNTFKVGDTVRIAQKRGIFAKEGQNWSDEIYVIDRVNIKSVVVISPTFKEKRLPFEKVLLVPRITNDRMTRKDKADAENKRRVEQEYKAQRMYNRLMH